jgi:dolichyl-phosphate beta-glucosyltransferase
MLAARGDRLLFADADGATPIGEADKLVHAIDQGADVAIGSRLVEAAGLTRRRTPLRRLAGRGFARLARSWLKIPQQDTQCGFKMFRRDAGQQLFSQVKESGYLFDLELLALAHRRGYRVVEVPVNWSEVAGSHLRLSREAGRILIGLWRIRRRLRHPTQCQ